MAIVTDITRADEKLHELGYIRIEKGIIAHAANAYMVNQGVFAPPVAVHASYVRETSSGEVIATSIIKQDGVQSLVTLPLNGLQLRDNHPVYPNPSKVSYADFVAGSPLISAPVIPGALIEAQTIIGPRTGSAAALPSQSV